MSSQHGHHVIPKKILFRVFGILVFLTLLTGFTAEYVDIGAFNIPLALAIAGSKAALVVMFFMALKYDNRVNTLVFMFGGVFVLVFLVFTLFDTVFRGDLGNVGSETISDIERLESVRRDREANLPSGPAPTGMAGVEDSTTVLQDDQDPVASDTADVETEVDTTGTSPATQPGQP